MDAIRMLVFAGSTPVLKALAAMKQHKRSGIVLAIGEERWIVKAVDLLQARNDGVRQLSGVTKRHAVYNLTVEDVATHNLQLLDPRRSEADYEKLLDAMRRSYARLPLEPVFTVQGLTLGGLLGFADIVTRHERQAAELSTPGDCYCTGPQQHSFPPPTASSGKPCPTGDGGTVVCE